MIIISALGGLGNQMYEYSFYQATINAHPSEIVKLDTNYALKREHNGYEVERIFSLRSLKATYSEVKRLGDFCIAGEQDSKLAKLSRSIRFRIGLTKPSFIRQNDYTAFERPLVDLRKGRDYYLYGAFCNYQYFKGIDAMLPSIFAFPPLDERNKLHFVDTDKQIVSLHIRRGDYVSLNAGLLGADYYKAALRLLEETTISQRPLKILVFSDDTHLARECLANLPYDFVYIDGNTGANSYKDMQMMSLCEHNIIANSSFSFWGAFLNKNPDKLVICSKQPFAGCSQPFSYPGWIEL